jgi:hypothetical protein
LDKEMSEHKQVDVPIEALLRRRVTGGLIVAVLLTVFLSFVSWRSAERAGQDAYWVSHTYEVMATIQGTSRDVLETETSARAFALIGQRREQLYPKARRLRSVPLDRENSGPVLAGGQPVSYDQSQSTTTGATVEHQG